MRFESIVYYDDVLFESSVNLNDWSERMAKDDYHVIAYRILAYLYECLKEGNYPDIKYISHDSEAVNINLNYWEYIIRHLYADGYIEGVFLGNVVGRKTPMIKFEDLAITPLGIEYLQDNYFPLQASCLPGFLLPDYSDC